jgi:drug/metabolite transporter (DMT)-like permease
MKKFLPYIFGTIMAVIFGFSFLFSKNALDVIGVFDLLFLRFLTAAVTMTILKIFGIIKIDLKGKPIKPLILVAVFQPVLYFTMENTGLKYTASSQAGIMMAFIPVLVTLLAWIVLKEEVTKYQIAFIIVSVSGVLLTAIGSGNLSEGGELKGILFILCAVASASLYNIFSRKASKTFTPYEITFFMMWVGTLVFGTVFVVQGLSRGEINIFHRLTFPAVISILYLGILSSVVAFLLSNYNLSKLKASQSSVFANLTTVVSVIAGITIRNESFGALKIIGAIMIIIGVWGTNSFKAKGEVKKSIPSEV